VSRSHHTNPPRVRAARRLRAPYAGRAVGDTSSRYALERALKECGVVAPPPRASIAPQRPPPLPRTRVMRPGSGRVHPAGRADIERVLRFFGERCIYGLRSIRLVDGHAAPATGGLLLGRLLVPGCIVLYAQPPSPWLLPGRLTARDEERLRRAGALVERFDSGAQTSVTWPGDTLRDFMLFDVLMHEVGHHLI
jgi:hypothetical protein